MKELLAQLAPHKTVAVVGLAKNTGKTVTVNYLVAGAGQGLRLGLTSTGRDGETIDTLTALPKPSIFLPQDAILATAAGSLTKGSSRLEILETTGINNILGEIVLARVREAGTVEVSGPERTRDLQEIIHRLQNRSDLVIVDGALDRIAASAPSITGAVILATGAVLSQDMRTVVQSTVHCARLLMIPGAEDLSEEAKQLIHAGKTAVQDGEGTVVLLPFTTVVDAPLELLDYLSPEYNTLLLGGALTDELAEMLVPTARRIPGLKVIVRDGTRIFVEPSRWQRLMRTGTDISVLEAINLVAVTVNPVGTWGRQLPGKQLVSALKQLLPELMVLDPLAGGG